MVLETLGYLTADFTPSNMPSKSPTDDSSDYELKGHCYDFLAKKMGVFGLKKGTDEWYMSAMELKDYGTLPNCQFMMQPKDNGSPQCFTCYLPYFRDMDGNCQQVPYSCADNGTFGGSSEHCGLCTQTCATCSTHTDCTSCSSSSQTFLLNQRCVTECGT
jgi:hypothetical protein